MKRWLALVLFLIVFGFYLRQAAPAVTTGDSGEFMAAAATLSIPHAPSFPLYVLSARSFMTLTPWGSIPYKANAFSAFAAALTVLVVFLIASAIGADVVVAVLAALSLAFSFSFWMNGLVTEVFALNALLTALLFLCLVKAIDDTRYLVLFAFLLGLGLGNHHILVLVAGGLLVLGASFVRRLPWVLAFGLLGFSIYTVLPVRAVKDPPLNWGKPATVEKFTRTLLRKDYGTMKLATGETPDRSLAASAKHLKRFFMLIAREIPWPLLILGFAAWGWGLFRRDPAAIAAAIVFFLTGPFFQWLGNLPFTAQSSGIMGRFLIMPVMMFVFGSIPFFVRFKKPAALFLLATTVVCFGRGYADAASHRQALLVWDYGRAMLSTLPRGAGFYLDGGDDAFYSLVLLHHAMGRRPDVEIHDRGGLVFRNPYGDDFRRITKEEKNQRRWDVERRTLAVKPVFYSTMDMNALPGTPLQSTGFLLQAIPPGTKPISFSWPHIALRGLYPLKPFDYRTRALGAFFPYMRGRWELSQGRLDSALAFFRRAVTMGYDIEWLHLNIDVDFGRIGYDRLMAGDLATAEKIYMAWLAVNPKNLQPHSNLGVVLERQGRLPEARRQYERAAELFPDAADPVFNLGVLAWKARDWPRVVSYFEEVLRRNPNHPAARGFLEKARMEMGRAPS